MKSGITLKSVAAVFLMVLALYSGAFMGSVFAPPKTRGK
jgi:hypothetical protein